MPDPDPNTISEFNDQVIAEFRANGGRVGGALAGTAMLLLHHIGARSGIERVTPLAYTRYGEDAFVIVASNGGSPTHPSWYYNLKANPRIEVEVGTSRFTGQAFELDGLDRADLWPKLVDAAPAIGEFQAETTRRIPILVLRRKNQPPATTRKLTITCCRGGG
jgi:deazaflavin-dependent oxidoreductase (nitroreductase family)